jgi:hypothetical protein
MFAVRGPATSASGDAALVRAGASVTSRRVGDQCDDAGRSRRSWPTRRVLLELGADPNAARRVLGAARRDHAPRREAWSRAPRARRRCERAGAKLDADAPLVEGLSLQPELVGATPFWLAARFAEPAVMRHLVKHGADPLFVHHGERVVDGPGGSGFQHRTDVTTALMAAVGMGGGEAWSTSSAASAKR